MAITGGCYCGNLRFEADGPPMMRGQCHCRECQYYSGGGPNLFVAVPVGGFRYTKGQPKGFTRSDLEGAVTRDFCPDCGTPICAKPQNFPAAIIKVGVFDDPSTFQADLAIQTADMQTYHTIPDGIPRFERFPGG